MPESLFSGSNKLPFPELSFHRIHACFGFYCLLHFGYRYGIFFGNGVIDDMGFDECLKTANRFLLLLLPHFLLQLSGFRFVIPRKRNPDGNRIWPQYRYEALIFFNRCLALMAIALYRKLHRGGLEAAAETSSSSFSSIWPATLVVFVTMMSADWVASIYRQTGEQSRTIRDLNGPPGALYLMSSAQFHANVHCLLIQDRLCVQFAALTVVQMTAFGMTLRRKRIISTVTGLWLYSLVLVLGMAVIMYDLMDREIMGMALTIGNSAAVLRFELGLNKYLLWGLVAYLLQECAKGETSSWYLDQTEWRGASVMTTIVLMLGAARRQGLLGRCGKQKAV